MSQCKQVCHLTAFEKLLLPYQSACVSGCVWILAAHLFSNWLRHFHKLAVFPCLFWPFSLMKSHTQSALFVQLNHMHTLMLLAVMKSVEINFQPFSVTDGLLQLHQDFTAYKQHTSVCVWNVCLQPHLCLYSKSLYLCFCIVTVFFFFWKVDYLWCRTWYI